MGSPLAVTQDGAPPHGLQHCGCMRAAKETPRFTLTASSIFWQRTPVILAFPCEARRNRSCRYMTRTYRMTWAGSTCSMLQRLCHDLVGNLIQDKHFEDCNLSSFTCSAAMSAGSTNHQTHVAFAPGPAAIEGCCCAVYR